jgi:hypothetical protein
MKNANEDQDATSAPKKLTVEDLKKIIGGTAQPRVLFIETYEGNKIRPS